MSSPPRFSYGIDSIPNLESPISTDSSSLPSPPQSPHTTPLHRSKTAPPPLPPPNPAVPPTLEAEDGPLTSIPPPRAAAISIAIDASVPPSAPSSKPVTPVHQPSALRRISSSLSNDSVPTSRERKRLRFTPFTNAEAGPSGLDVDVGDVFFPGASLDQAEEGRSRGRKGIPRDQVDWLRSDPGTPNLQETADQIRRTLSLASLDQLLVLSANQAGERDRLLAQVSRVGKDLVWREHNEKRLLPRDTERALVLAFKRGMRSLLLAFSVRAGVNVILVQFRTLQRRGLQFRLLWHAAFGAEPLRFGAMIGTFTFLNTLTLHLLRLAPPLSYFRRRLRNGFFVRPTFGPPEREGDEGESRWQAAVAGAVGSLGLLWESKSRRTGVAQQMFVRGLQGSYNLYTPQYGIHIPHGDILLFGACCGQIMFAWLLSPETIPQGYNQWISHASRVPEFGRRANQTSVRQRIIESIQVEKALQYKTLSPTHKATLEGLLGRMKNGWNSPTAAPCAMIHPWCDSCPETSFRRFFSVFRLMLPIYSALHLIPTIVLRRHHVRRDPLRMLAKVIWGITRSCSFLGVFVVIYQVIFCARTQILEQAAGMDALKVVLRRKEFFWFVGLSTSLSLFVEEKKRRAELAMYVLPRALESAWSSARRRAWVPIVPFGETILGAAAMAMVMDAYKHQPDALSGIVRRLLYQLVGPV